MLAYTWYCRRGHLWLQPICLRQERVIQPFKRTTVTSLRLRYAPSCCLTRTARGGPSSRPPDGSAERPRPAWCSAGAGRGLPYSEQQKDPSPPGPGGPRRATGTHPNVFGSSTTFILPAAARRPAEQRTVSGRRRGGGADRRTARALTQRRAHHRPQQPSGRHRRLRRKGKRPLRPAAAAWGAAGVRRGPPVPLPRRGARGAALAASTPSLRKRRPRWEVRERAAGSVPSGGLAEAGRRAGRLAAPD